MNGYRLGSVILLNGTSSSGKSSIARELLGLLERPWFHMAVDAFGAMRAVNHRGRLTPDEVDEMLRRTRAGFHRAVAGMAEAGNDVVVDHVLSEPWRLRDLLDLLRPYDVYFVGVRCAPDELTRREVARGDRTPGQAAAQIERVHAHGDYDLEVDTTRTGARECAERIAAAWERRGPGPHAFDRLRTAGR